MSEPTIEEIVNIKNEMYALHNLGIAKRDLYAIFVDYQRITRYENGSDERLNNRTY